MILRISWGKVRPGTWKEYEETYKRTVVSPGVRIEGLQGRWLAQDLTDPDAGVVMSLWDSLEQVQAYERSGFFQNTVQAALRPFFVGEYQTRHCEVKYGEQEVAS